MAGEIVFYQSDDGTIRLETRLENETLWLTQQQMAELFQTSKQNISHHIRSIYAEGELAQEATVKNYLTVQSEGNFHSLLPAGTDCYVLAYGLDLLMSHRTNSTA